MALNLIYKIPGKCIPRFQFQQLVCLFMCYLPGNTFFKRLYIFQRRLLRPETIPRSKTIRGYRKKFGNVFSVYQVVKPNHSFFEEIKIPANFPFFKDNLIFRKFISGKSIANNLPIGFRDGGIVFKEFF